MTQGIIPAQAQVSIEYFPPRNLSSERALLTGAHALRRFEPSCQTITFGADGSGTEGSLDWSVRLQSLNNIPTACHLAMCRFDHESLAEHAHQLWNNDIKSLVVIRGDQPEGQEIANSPSVVEGIEILKSLYPFDISVSAYPETHPKAVSASADLQALIAKQKAGADRAITQYFFDNELYYRFVKQARAAGFRKPIVPGIMPIANFEKIIGFSEKCGASIPDYFHPLFAGAGDDKKAQSDVARQLVEEQVRDLAQSGVDAIHIYSLNRVDLTADAIRAFYESFEDEFDQLPALAG